MKYYVITTRLNNNLVIDSISSSYFSLKRRFPTETIYELNEFPKSIYVNKDILGNRVFTVYG